MMSSVRYSGTVIKYDVEKGFGFIKPKDSSIKQDIFIHFAEIEVGVDAFKKLRPNEEVNFVMHTTNRGLAAKDLKRGEIDGNY